MRIVVGRMENLKTVDVEEGTCVIDAFINNGFTKAEGEVVQDLESNEYDDRDEVESRMTYVLVQRVKSGQ